MTVNFLSILTKLYWPVVTIYIILLLIFIIMYFTEAGNWSNRSYYLWMNVKRIGVPGLFLLTSLWLRYLDNQKMANIILYIPVGFSIVIMLGGLFMLILFMINSK